MRIQRHQHALELAQFLMDYHSGQWSRGYRLLSRLLPGGSWSSEFAQSLRETEAYQYFVNRFAKTV